MTYDEHTRRLAWRELRRIGEDPPWPAHISAAQAAKHELIDKHHDDLEWSRDTRRAIGAFDRKIAAFEDSVVDLARAKGLAPPEVKARPGVRTKTVGVHLQAGPDDGLDDGQFTAYASVFGNRDAHGDVVLPGAFAKSLAAWASRSARLPLLFGHRLDDPDYNIGHVVAAEEDDHGLLVTAQLDLDSPKAAQVYRLLKARRIDQMSFAYDVLDSAPVERDGVRCTELREVALHEVSVVPLGANPQTEVLAVKAAPAARLRSALTTTASERTAMTLEEKRSAAHAAATALIEKVEAGDESVIEEAEAKVAEAKALDDEAHKRGAALVQAVGGMAPGERHRHESPLRVGEYVHGARAVSGGSAGQTVRHLNLKNLAGDIARGMSETSARVSPGIKGLVPAGETVVNVPLVNPADPLPMTPDLEHPPRLVDVLPIEVRQAPVYAFLRQTHIPDSGAAAVVPVGSIKPTKRLGIERVNARLRVLAVLSDPQDKFLLEDAGNLRTWVAAVLADEIENTLEAQVLSGDGEGENFTGLASTSGIQVQGFESDRLITVQYALSRLASLGVAAQFVALAAADWLAIQTARRQTASGFDVGGPVDATAQTAWGAPVVVVPTLAAGTGYVVGADALTLSTDDRGVRVEWGTPGDTWSRNQLVARVEARLGLDVMVPHRVVRLDLSEPDD